MKFPRGSSIIGAASVFASVCLPRFQAGAAEFTYKLSTDVPTTLPMTSRALEAASQIRRESDGRMEVEVYPNAVLGSEADQIEQTRIGAIQFVEAPDNALSSVVPATGLTNLPFLFPSYQAVWAACDGPVGNYMRAAISKAGLFPFKKAWDGTIKQTFNKVRPINTPDDLKGLKIRVPPSLISTATFKALGAAATPLPYREVYTSLQTRLIDGTDMGYSTVVGGKLFEVLKYASATRHQWGGVFMVANADAWQRLPQKLRDIVDRSFDAAAQRERDDDLNGEQVAAQQLKSLGMILNNVDLTPFRAAVRNAGLYAQWRSNYGDTAWALLEKAVGPLA